MGPAPDITLYASVYSRSFTARWMLAELGLPHRVQDTDIRTRKQKHPDYLRINPMGKVPAIVDGGVVVTENRAICLYLADRYGLGTLAPPTDDPLRGPYLRWTIFATAVFEPAVYLDEPDDPAAASGRGWGRRETVLGVIEDLLSHGPWILGERFSTPTWSWARCCRWPCSTSACPRPRSWPRTTPASAAGRPTRSPRRRTGRRHSLRRSAANPANRWRLAPRAPTSPNHGTGQDLWIVDAGGG